MTVDVIQYGEFMFVKLLSGRYAAIFKQKYLKAFICQTPYGAGNALISIKPSNYDCINSHIVQQQSVICTCKGTIDLDEIL